MNLLEGDYIRVPVGESAIGGYKIYRLVEVESDGFKTMVVMDTGISARYVPPVTGTFIYSFMADNVGWHLVVSASVKKILYAVERWSVFDLLAIDRGLQLSP